MTEIIRYVFLTTSIIMLIGSIYFSIKSKRKKDPQARGRYAAATNIFLGIFLISLALLQFTFEFSITRTIICSIFLLLGLFNLFAGIRNHAYFTRR